MLKVPLAGTGVLTEELLKHDIQLTDIENDHGLMEGLQTRFEKVQIQQAPVRAGSRTASSLVREES